MPGSASRVSCFLFLIAAITDSSRAFEYEDLVALIKERNLTSLEEVLDHLPEEYLENYTLAFGSRSVQESSHNFPRAILFGRDAKLVLTFNGDPDQHGYHDLELMQFRDRSNEFEMREIIFGDDVEFPPKNPPVCLACHGRKPRPLWSSYEYSDIEEASIKHWPGIYGSTHDTPRLNEDEQAAFERYRAQASEHPRYRFLKQEHPQSESYPYGAGPFHHRFRPNNRLGNLLARLNAKRIASDLMGREFFRRYPNLSLLWMLQCTAAEEPRVLDFGRRLYERDYSSLSHVRLPQYYSRSLEQVTFVFEKLFSGLDIYTWNLSLTPSPDDPRFFTGIVTIDELVAAAVLAQLPEDHWLREHYIPWTQKELYDTFQQGYYEANLEPGGVGNSYNELGPFFDREYAKEACPRLQEYAEKEMAAAES